MQKWDQNPPILVTHNQTVKQKKYNQHFLSDNLFCTKIFFEADIFSIILPFLSSLAKVANPDPPPAATVLVEDFWQFFL